MKNAEQLPDIQSTKDERGIDLQFAGIKELRLPLLMEFAKNKKQKVDAIVSLAVGVPSTDRGTHMSRLVEMWSGYYCQDWGQDLSNVAVDRQAEHKVIKVSLEELLAETCSNLGALSAMSKIRFTYYIQRQAPVTSASALLAVDCSYSASLQRGNGEGNDNQKKFRQVISVNIPISTLCPCSKAISKYGAHNQRAFLSASLILSDMAISEGSFSFDEIIPLLEESASSKVFPLLKRPDERHVTETQHENAKFVEDVVRDAVGNLRKEETISGFFVEVVALESIHAHNACAWHSENFSYQDLQ